MKFELVTWNMKLPIPTLHSVPVRVSSTSAFRIASGSRKPGVTDLTLPTRNSILKAVAFCLNGIVPSSQYRVWSFLEIPVRGIPLGKFLPKASLWENKSQISNPCRRYPFGKFSNIQTLNLVIGIIHPRRERMKFSCHCSLSMLPLRGVLSLSHHRFIVSAVALA